VPKKSGEKGTPREIIILYTNGGGARGGGKWLFNKIRPSRGHTKNIVGKKRPLTVPDGGKTKDLKWKRLNVAGSLQCPEKNEETSKMRSQKNVGGKDKRGTLKQGSTEQKEKARQE